MGDYRIVEADWEDDLVIKDNRVIAKITFKTDTYGRTQWPVREEIRALIEGREPVR